MPSLANPVVVRVSGGRGRAGHVDEDIALIMEM